MARLVRIAAPPGWMEAFVPKANFKTEDIEACETAGHGALRSAPAARSFGQGRPVPQRRVQIRGRDRQHDLPAGQRLQPYTSSLLRGLKKINYANRVACRDCPLRPRCTGNQFRSVSRLENEAVLDRMAARLAQRPGILDQRRELVEHPFGTIKQWMYQGAFLMRGLEKVRAEFSLTALAYNIRRVLNCRFRRANGRRKGCRAGLKTRRPASCSRIWVASAAGSSPARLQLPGLIGRAAPGKGRWLVGFAVTSHRQGVFSTV